MKRKLLTLLATVLLVCLMCIPTMAKSVTKDGKQVDKIIPTSITTAYGFSYSQADSLGTYDNYNHYGVVIPLQVTSGGYMSMDLSLNTTDTAESFSVELYTDKECTKEYEYNYSKLSMFVSSYSQWADVDDVHLKAGTYYLKIYSDSYGSYEVDPFQNTGVFKVNFISNADRTLASGKKTTIGYSASGTYVKVVAPKDGDIYISGTEYTQVQLYNSKKVAITKQPTSLNKYNKNTIMFPVKKGTYYVLCKQTKDTYVVGYQFKETPTLKASKSYSINPADSKQNYYVKIKPSKTGYITFSISKDLSGYITLCDSKKKALCKESWIYGNSSYSKYVTFAVKKNTTYYIKMRSSDSIFSTKYSFKAVTEKSGSKVKNAVSFKKGKTVSGLILPGESKKDYYKFTLSKSQTVKLKIKGNVSSGSIQIKIYSDSKLKKSAGSTSIYNYGHSITLTSGTFGKTGKLSKGTYYIVVQRTDKYSNGNYSIQWMK